jgi:hypothetical protein
MATRQDQTAIRVRILIADPVLGVLRSLQGKE